MLSLRDGLVVVLLLGGIFPVLQEEDFGLKI
jgi:hypothetical protein